MREAGPEATGGHVAGPRPIVDRGGHGPHQLPFILGGALFAAVNFVATGTDATLGPRLVELVAPGPGRDAIEAQSSGGSASNLRAQVAGFKVSAYSADAATIDLALNYSGGELVSVPLKLVWVEGDWKVEMTDAGELPLAPAQIQNLGGYTPWSGA